MVQHFRDKYLFFLRTACCQEVESCGFVDRDFNIHVVLLTPRRDVQGESKWHHFCTSYNFIKYQLIFKFFSLSRIRRQFAIKLSLQIPPLFKCVATLSCEISDDALKPTTPLTSCVINVDRAFHLAPKQPRLKTVNYAVWGVLQQMAYQFDNSQQSTSWSKRLSLMSGANCRSIWFASLVSGVAFLDASSSSKADALNIWRKNCEIWPIRQ